MSDVRITTAMRDLRARMAGMASDMVSEMDNQLKDLDKMKQIAALHKDLGVGSPELDDTIAAFETAAKLIRDQLSKPLPEE